MKIYLKDKKALAFFSNQANSQFWDKLWEIDNLKKYLKSFKTYPPYTTTVMKYLPKGSKILEGGCGRGQIVYALYYSGYQAIGIDFAKKTIESIKKAVPELDVRYGDVRKLPIDDNELDGYISVGVIEHFWDGYEDIIKEMERTIKKNGYLFISFPFMSLLRKLKALLHFYPHNKKEMIDGQIDKFYQFALDHKKIINDIEKLGFSYVKRINEGGLKGLKDEVYFLKPFLQNIFDGKLLPGYRSKLDNFLTHITPHVILLVFRKNV